MLDRFSNKVIVLSNGCHQWTGAKDRDGYGKFQLDGKCIFAHRYAYQCRYGALDTSLVIDHLCRNRACVNPEHMEQVTTQENTRRGGHYESLKTHCDHGHEFTDENTYICTRGWRNCRTCRKIADRKRRAKRCLS